MRQLTILILIILMSGCELFELERNNPYDNQNYIPPGEQPGESYKPNINFKNCETWSNYTTDKIYIISGSNLFISNDNAKSWKYVKSLPFASNLPLRIYQNQVYGSDGQNIYKSKDSGSTWVKLPNLSEPERIEGFDVNFNTDEVYVCTNYALFKLDNDKWTRIKTTTQYNGSEWIEVDNEGKLYYSVYSFTIHTSTDKGETWKEYKYNSKYGISSTTGMINVTDNNEIIVSTWHNGIWKFKDETFLSINNGIKPALSSSWRAYETFGLGNNYYTSVRSYEQFEGIFISNDKGESWKNCKYEFDAYDLRNFTNMSVNKSETVVISIKEKGCYKVNKEQSKWDPLE